MSTENESNDVKAPAKKRPGGLGRGLDSLMGEAVREEPISGAPSSNPDLIRSLPISNIKPHPDQPRRHFSDDALDELAESIAKRGVVQPIVVRPLGKGYQIVAGERRWRASQRARLHQIPAIVRDFDDSETFEIALVENVQREDLNPIEEAEAFSRLISEYGHTQKNLSKLVGKSRSHIANLIRLLDLPEAVRAFVAQGEIAMGHARALINAEDPATLARIVIDDGLSVRDTEKLARRAKPDSQRSNSPASRAETAVNADIRAVEQHLGDLLGLKVKISQSGDNGAGAVTLNYSNLDQLDMICQRLTGEKI